MARFYGKVGFAVTREVRPGIFKEVYKEKYYKGDIVKSNRRWDAADKLNDDISINNDISIISDSFAMSHFGVMRYVRFKGRKGEKDQLFEITSAMLDTDTHRITLSLGGVFNVPEPD